MPYDPMKELENIISENDDVKEIKTSMDAISNEDLKSKFRYGMLDSLLKGFSTEAIYLLLAILELRISRMEERDD